MKESGYELNKEKVYLLKRKNIDMAITIMLTPF